MEICKVFPFFQTPLSVNLFQPQLLSSALMVENWFFSCAFLLKEGKTSASKNRSQEKYHSSIGEHRDEQGYSHGNMCLHKYWRQEILHSFVKEGLMDLGAIQPGKRNVPWKVGNQSHRESSRWCIREAIVTAKSLACSAGWNVSASLMEQALGQGMSMEIYMWWQIQAVRFVSET